MTREEFKASILKAKSIDDIILPKELSDYSNQKSIEESIVYNQEIQDHLNNICPYDFIFLVIGINPQYTSRVSSVIRVLEEISGLEFPFYAKTENKFIFRENRLKRSLTLLLPNNKTAHSCMFNVKEYKITKLIEESAIKIE